MTKPSALYVHVPFCASKCAYCDFFSVPIAQAGEGYIDSLVDAIADRAKILSERFAVGCYETLYVGGGTPTALPLASLSRLLEALAPLAHGAAEWSVEANPESLTPDKLDAMLKAGVSRLSLGVQSLGAGELTLLERPHDAARAEAALRLAADSPLELSADLMAGLPEPRASGAVRRGRRDLAAEVARCIELGVSHLSLYDLIVEEGTRIASALDRRELAESDEDEAWAERAAAEAALSGAGFRHYEVSNYAPEGRECRHNLAYWRMDSYLGAGPGAVSTIAGFEGGASLRIEESRDLRSYPEGAETLARETPIPPRDAAFESIMMAFRTRFGLDREVFERRFGIGIQRLLPRSLDAWSARLVPGWGGDACLAMDERGLDLLNRFLRDCLEEMEERPGPLTDLPP